MKRTVPFLIIFLVLVVAIVSSADRVILFFARKQLTKALGGSTVLIRGCQLEFPRRLRFLDIEIHKPSQYDFKLGELSAEFNISSILKRNILKLSLKDAAVVVDLPHQDLLAFRLPSGPSSAASGMLSVNTVELSNFTVDIKSQDVGLQARGSVAINVIQRTVDSLDLEVPSLSWKDFLLKEAAAKIVLRDSGDLSIQDLQYGKFKVQDVKARVRSVVQGFLIEALSAQTLKGKIAGDLSFIMKEFPEYFAKLNFTGLDLAEVVQEFDLKEKVQMSGIVSGQLTVTGRGADLNILDGVFKAADSGGLLVIKDNNLLENIARKSQQSMDIIVASFKDYHYNVGSMQFSLEKDNLNFDAAFDGETGKRNLKITLHDFNQRKDGL